jgi:hypothetical protein
MTSKLQGKHSTLKREHLALQTGNFLNFFKFLGIFSLVEWESGFKFSRRKSKWINEDPDTQTAHGNEHSYPPCLQLNNIFGVAASAVRQR